jgi:transcriptional regulator with XRE-family HTH domain
MGRKEQIKEHFGRHIQQLRLKQNLSIRALAARSGLEYSQVQRIENGKVNLALTTIYGLAEGLDLPIADLFSDLQ